MSSCHYTFKNAQKIAEKDRLVGEELPVVALEASVFIWLRSTQAERRFYV
jgi:hypothetical protein